MDSLPILLALPYLRGQDKSGGRRLLQAGKEGGARRKSFARSTMGRRVRPRGPSDADTAAAVAARSTLTAHGGGMARAVGA